MSTFGEYAQSEAFRIELSKRQIAELMIRESAVDKRVLYGKYGLNMGVLHALQRRGLIDWYVKADGSKNGLYITDAGKAVCRVLELAGYSVEKFLEDAA